jgi:Protein of unknown function (DUF3237)
VSIELVSLGTMVTLLRAPHSVGNRLIFELEDGWIEGERVNAKMKGQSSADWLTLSPEGIGTLDVRALCETDDGALVFIQYNGRIDMNSADAPVYSAPRFDTADERYRWLNAVQAVGKGTFDGGRLEYELYEVR